MKLTLDELHLEIQVVEKPPSKPSNALSTAKRRQKLAAKHHGIYEISPFFVGLVLMRIQGLKAEVKIE